MGFASFEAARCEAIRAAGEMIRELTIKQPGDEWRMEVADDSGRPVLRLRFMAEEVPK